VIITLAIRSLLSRPVRSAVLIGGFGLGVAVMAVLLGVGSVILDQARAPALRGGGDIVVGGSSGRLVSARFILAAVLGAGSLAPRVATASPSERADLYLLDGDGAATPVRARGGIPSLERAMRDPETRALPSWTDTPADRAWSAPSAEAALAAMDKFHPVPDVPARSRSWAEWLYFNGRTDAARFYLTFLAGPPLGAGKRTLGVRLQLERGGVMNAYAASADVDSADLLAAAPNLSAGRNRVRLVGREYQLSLDLPAESGRGRVSGEIAISADLGRSMPPLVIRGAAGWVSGYVVPVTSGALRGTLQVDGRPIDFDGGAGYHDHNWGFWNGVSWQWGQVQHDGVSLVFGRVHPPADAADASRVPGLVVALGPDGPIGFASDVTIEETNEPGADRPQRIVVRGRGDSLDVTLDATVRQTTVTEGRARTADQPLDFLQLRADYHVVGRAGSLALDFSALGSAETFRGSQ